MAHNTQIMGHRKDTGYAKALLSDKNDQLITASRSGGTFKKTGLQANFNEPTARKLMVLVIYSQATQWIGIWDDTAAGNPANFVMAIPVQANSTVVYPVETDLVSGLVVSNSTGDPTGGGFSVGGNTCKYNYRFE